MCKHNERTDISPGLTAIYLYWFYYCPGEENSQHFLILFSNAESIRKAFLDGLLLLLMPSSSQLVQQSGLCGNFI